MGNLSPIAHAGGGLSTSFAPGNIAKLGAGAWTLTTDTGGTLTNADVAGGGLVLATDGTDNDCATAHFGGQVNPGTVGSRFGYLATLTGTEGATDDADWFAGFSDVVSASFFGDDEALASMDAVGFYKVGGSMFFRTCVLNAAAQSGATLTTAFAADTEYKLRVEGEVGTTGITVRFYVDEVLVATVSDITTTNMTTMYPVLVVSNSSGNANSIEVRDFIPYGNQ